MGGAWKFLIAFRFRKTSHKHLCRRVCVKWRVYMLMRGILFLRMYLWWKYCTLYLLACHVRVTLGTQVFFLLCLWDVFRALINSLVCWFHFCFVLSFLRAEHGQGVLGPTRNIDYILRMVILRCFWVSIFDLGMNVLMGKMQVGLKMSERCTYFHWQASCGGSINVSTT